MSYHAPTAAAAPAKMPAVNRKPLLNTLAPCCTAALLLLAAIATAVAPNSTPAAVSATTVATASTYSRLFLSVTASLL
ncbi:hypothetical protein D3C76_1039170 [compost metagenome]